MTTPKCNEIDVVNICRDGSYVAKLVKKVTSNSQNSTVSKALLRFANVLHTCIYEELRSFTKLTLSVPSSESADSKLNKDTEVIDSNSDKKLSSTNTQLTSQVDEDENELDKLKSLSIGGFKIGVKQKQQKKRMKPNLVAEKPASSTFVPGNINTIDSSKELIDIRKELKDIINTPTIQTTSAIPLTKPSSSTNTIEYSKNCEECSKHEDLPSAQRMATMYSIFILHQYIPLINLLELIQLLITIDPYVANATVLCTCKQLQLQTSNHSRANTKKPHVILINGKCIRAFLRCLLEELLTILSNFGPLFIKEIIESSIVRTWMPEIIVKIKEITGSSTTSSSDSISFKLPETFIKPFREECDSKNEFRTQLELGIFYERERIYDEFSSLYLKFQTIHRRDLDGSTTAAFFRTDLPLSGHTILNLRDANYMWFADLFLQQLLFYGTTRSSTSPLTAASSTLAAPILSDRDNGNTTITSTSTSIDSFKTSTPSPSTTVSVPVSTVRTLPIDTSKQSRLEARLGGGGQVQPSPFSSVAKSSRARYHTHATTTINNNATTHHNISATTTTTTPTNTQSSTAATPVNTNTTMPKRIHTSATTTTNRKITPGMGSATSNSDNYAEQGLYFCSSQQFFFRFIIIMNNYRFNQCLIDCILIEIEKLSKNDNITQMQHNTTSMILENNNNEKKELHLSLPYNLNINNNSNTTIITNHSNTTTNTSTGTTSSDYFITPENYALKVTKLKILGKFLGFLHFYSRWVPTGTPTTSTNNKKSSNSSSTIIESKESTITNNSINSASTPTPSPTPIPTTTITSGDNKSMHNKISINTLNHQNTFLKLTLSIYDVLINSRQQRQLALCIPWVAEFMKMLKWEPTVVWLSTLVDTRNTLESLHLIPYYNSLLLLYSIQKSNDFLLSMKNITGNRMYVLLELQSLWRFLPNQLVTTIYTHPTTIVEPIPRPARTESRENTPTIEQIMTSDSAHSNRSTMQELSYLSGSADLGLDDQDLAFTAVFLHHVVPDLETLYIRMRTARLMHSNGMEERHRRGLAAGSTRKIKRQTPSILTAEEIALQAALSNTTASAIPTLTDAAFGLKSAIDEQLPPAPVTPSKAKRAVSITSTTSASLDSTTLAVGKSPRKKKSIFSTNTNDRTVPVDGQSHSLRCTPTKNRDRVRTPSFESISSAVHPSSSTAGAVEVSSPRATLFGDYSNKLIQQQPATSLSESINTSGRSSPATTLLSSDRRSVRSYSDLNTSFTLRHPSFGSSPMKSTGGGAALMMSPLKAGEFGSDRTDILERLEIAFWNQHLNLQNLSNFLLSQAYQACLAHIKERVGNAVRELLNNLISIRNETNIHHFEDQVEMYLKRTHYEAVCDGDEFINEFYASFTHNILPKMCHLYPQNIRVIKLAIFFMTRHFRAQKEPLLTHLKVYCLRKLRELSELCTKQQYKQLAELAANNANTTTTTTTTIYNHSSPLTTAAIPPGISATASGRLQNSMLAPVGATAKDSSNPASITTLPDTLAARLCSSLRLLDEHFLFTPLSSTEHSYLQENIIAIVLLQQECGCTIRSPLLSSIDTVCKLRNTIASILGALLDWIITLSELFAFFNTGNKECVPNLSTRISMTMKDTTGSSSVNSADTTIQLDLNVLYSMNNLKNMLTRSIIVISTQLDTAINRIVTVVTGLSSTRGAELKGKVNADIAKFLTSSLPYLFYLDMIYMDILITDNTKMKTKTKYVDIIHPVDVEGMKVGGKTEKNHNFPSDILFTILDCELISTDILVRILTLTSRAKTSAYFENCRGLTNIKTRLNQLLLDFIGRFLHRYQEKYGISFGKYEKEEKEAWYKDSSIRLLVKTVLKESFSSLISTLLMNL